jgi:hypothetical protein
VKVPHRRTDVGRHKRSVANAITAMPERLEDESDRSNGAGPALQIGRMRVPSYCGFGEVFIAPR